MSIGVPDFDVPGLSAFLRRVETDRDRQFATLLSAVTANRSVLLISPGKKVYEVKVSDAGALTVTLVSG
jgi:hypothetical protein